MNIRIVLVKPRNPLNIGAVARAMGNFGFRDLFIVDPYEPIWRETVSAVGAESLLHEARCVNLVEEAIGDCQLVLGTTAVKARQLERTVVRLPELEMYLKKYGVNSKQKIAILFGSEKSGLSKKDLELCHAYITIPTSAETPSMNLSHSVVVCCYELAKMNLQKNSPFREVSMATVEKRERLIKQLLELFEAVGYLKLDSDAQKIRKIRRDLIQWRLRSIDVRVLFGILRYISQHLKTETMPKSKD